MKLLSMRLHRLEIPLVEPFTTSFSAQTVRYPMLVELTAAFGDDVVTGWGECVALDAPVYSSEYTDGVAEVIRRSIAPRLAAVGEFTAETVASHLAPIVGNRMANFTETSAHHRSFFCGCGRDDALKHAQAEMN